jgi:transposase
MKQSSFILPGIDVSKAKIDVCVIINNAKSSLHCDSFEQSRKGFGELRKWLRKLVAQQKQEVLICIENTGFTMMPCCTF